MDNFRTQLKLPALKCDFRDNRESNERVLAECIVGIICAELQTDLLSIYKEFTTGQVGRTYEALISYMKQLAEAQGTDVINGVITFPVKKAVVAAADILATLVNSVQLMRLS